MAIKIFKYTLEIADRQEVQLPEGAKILAFQFQRGFPYIWAMVAEGAPVKTRALRIYGTGYQINIDDTPVQYVGTAQQGDWLAWHLFEEV